jgi:hypothetical protein
LGAGPATPAAETIVINCPGCGKRYELSGTLAGKKSRCRQCGEVFAIATPQAAVRQPETLTMTLLPEEPSTTPPQAPPESYWESVLADDTGDAQEQKGRKPADYDDFELPSPTRPAAGSRKSKRTGRDTGIGVAISGWFSVALLVLLAGAYGSGSLGLLSKSQVRGFVGVSLMLTMLACAILIIWGTIWLVVVAFREDAGCGLMFLFVPFYQLYYIWTRMAETKGPASMVAVAYFVIIGFAILGPTVDPDRGGGAIGDLAASAGPAAVASSQPPGLNPNNAVPDGLLTGEGIRKPFGPGPGPGFGLRKGGVRRNIPIPGPPVITPDQFANQIEAINSRYGNKAVILVFTGIPTNSDPAKGVTGDDVIAVISQRVKALVPAIETVMALGTDNHKALIVAPVDNPPALARSIRFGKATLQRDTRIRVDLSPEFLARVTRRAEQPASAPQQPAVSARPAPRSEAEIPIPADADPIVKSLLQLKSADMGKKKDAIHRLERTTPDKRLDEVVAALLQLLDDDDGFLVNDAIKALVVWRSPAVLPALIQRANDNRFFVRKEAVKALGKFKDERAVEAIIPHFKEDGFESEAALKEIGPMAEPSVIGLLQNADPHVRRTACNILRQIGGAETVRAMRAIPPDPDLGVRMAAKGAAEAIVARVGPVPRTSGAGKVTTGAGNKPRP